MSLQMTNCWDVLIAASGEEGVAIAATERPDVILLDAIMPGMDGLATLQRLKEDPKTQDLPVLLLTATMSPTTQQQYVQLGARAVLMKPFDPGTLARQIEQALGWSIEGTV
ncbi:MAG: response regulator [Leptolyngbyaceae cyanobacterium RU_5_1]|nr:response regulator [Leptolyngbyaceae cyanobacterium RU_5_1]